MAKKCNAQSYLGRQVFTAVGYAVLNADTKDLLLGVLEGVRPFTEAINFFPTSTSLDEYAKVHM